MRATHLHVVWGVLALCVLKAAVVESAAKSAKRKYNSTLQRAPDLSRHYFVLRWRHFAAGPPDARMQPGRRFLRINIFSEIEAWPVKSSLTLALCCATYPLQPNAVLL